MCLCMRCLYVLMYAVFVCACVCGVCMCLCMRCLYVLVYAVFVCVAERMDIRELKKLCKIIN